MKDRNSYFIKISLIFFIVVTVCGCAFSRKVVDNIAGNYMGGLKSDKANSKSEVFIYGLDECFEKVLAILNGKAIDTTILKTDRSNYSILVLVSSDSMLEDDDRVFDANSADVGIFLTKVGPRTTRVEIRSLSSIFTNYTAKQLFLELQKKN
ncbi:MAG: hypothetical protein ISS45_02760 [Candidatus Omnitrophica bacterium]|nr:hypothetical protein [Candidatus Omnitrophota bacterium]